MSSLAAQVRQIAAANEWPRDNDGKVHPQRDAEFWRPLDGGRIACDLCYRKCEIAPGEVGWCRTRRNEDGEMHLSDHGVLAGLVRKMNDYAGVGLTTLLYTHHHG